MPDIRDVLKGLSLEDKALYTEVRTQMRRSYLSAHTKLLPIEQYEQEDDYFLDLIDIKIAMLFDRCGAFNHEQGTLDTINAKEVEKTLEAAAEKLTNGIKSQASKMIQQPLQQQNGAAAQGWTTK